MHPFLRRLALCLTVALVWGGTVPVRAATISQVLPNGRSGLADYRPGEAGRPAVLVVHGFLQTFNFSTIAALVNDLADQGYTVLAPTLTLGIDGRSASLACDAIHTHTEVGEAEEVAAWVAWLRARGYADIALIGHSSGALTVLDYAAHADTAVRKVIAASLTSLDLGWGDHQR